MGQESTYELEDDGDEDQNYTPICLFIACILLCLALGVVGTVSYLRGQNVSELERQLTEAKTNARTGWGKYYALNEQLQDEESAELGKRSVRIFELESQLAICKMK